VSGLQRLLPPGTGVDASLVALRASTGRVVRPDRAEHADALFVWLNRWGCRLAYSCREQFALEVAGWWRGARRQLPATGVVLADVSDDVLVSTAAAASSLAELSLGPRRLQWTAAAKLLYALRPDAVPPWDDAIAVEIGGRSEAAFLAHLVRARRWAQSLPPDLGELVGRSGASVARIIDEWLYLTVTRGLRPGRRAGARARS
jgi:hypothetical protein